MGAFLDAGRQKVNPNKEEKSKKGSGWTQNTSSELDLIQFHHVTRGWAGAGGGTRTWSVTGVRQGDQSWGQTDKTPSLSFPWTALGGLHNP